MNNNDYMEKLSKKLSPYFDVKYDKKIYNIKFDLIAKFYERTSAFLLTKSLEYYAYQNYQYIFYNKISENFKKSDLNFLKTFLDENLKKIIKSEKEHMSTTFTFIYCGDIEIDDNTKKAVENFKYYKSFLLGLKGWANVKLVVLNPETQDLYTNKLARRDGNKFIFN